MYQELATRETIHSSNAPWWSEWWSEWWIVKLYPYWDARKVNDSPLRIKRKIYFSFIWLWWIDELCDTSMRKDRTIYPLPLFILHPVITRVLSKKLYSYTTSVAEWLGVVDPIISRVFKKALGSNLAQGSYRFTNLLNHCLFLDLFFIYFIVYILCFIVSVTFSMVFIFFLSLSFVNFKGVKLRLGGWETEICWSIGIWMCRPKCFHLTRTNLLRPWLCACWLMLLSTEDSSTCTMFSILILTEISV